MIRRFKKAIGVPDTEKEGHLSALIIYYYKNDGKGSNRSGKSKLKVSVTIWRPLMPNLQKNTKMARLP